MKKGNFTDILNIIREYPIEKGVGIISKEIDVIEAGNSLSGLCPFHGDTSHGSFRIGGNVFNGFKCFACDESGDLIKLVQEVRQTNFIRTVIDLAEYLEIIKKEDGKKLLKNIQRKVKIYPPKDKLVPLAKQKVQMRRNSNVLSKKEERNRNRAYLKLRNLSGQRLSEIQEITSSYLSPEDLEELVVHRQLDENDLNYYEFFTLDEKIDLSKIGELGEYRIPGFYKSSKIVSSDKRKGKVTLKEIQESNQKLFIETETMIPNYSGIALPIRSARENIIALQIRTRQENSRYLWFSSLNASKKGSKNSISQLIDEEQGTVLLEKEVVSEKSSPGSPLDVVYPPYGDWEWEENRTLFITEGKFKAIQLAKKYLSPVISVQGVSSFSGIAKVIREIMAYKKKKGEIQIILAYDADMAYNKQVAKQMRAMVEKELNLLDIKLGVILWNPENGKGIDDLMFNKGQFKVVSFQAYEKLEEYISASKNTRKEAFMKGLELLRVPMKKKG